jgi:hypothetical protein
MGIRKLLTYGLCLTACAPITTTHRVLETPRDGGTERDKPTKAKSSLAVTQSADGLVVSVEDALVCVEHKVTIVHRVEVTKRHPSTAVTVVDYMVGIVFGGAGGFAAAAPQTVIDQSGNMDYDAKQVRTAGAVTAGFGALFFTFGVVNSFRGGTSHRDLGDQHRPAADGTTVPCGVAPHAGDDVTLAVGDATYPLGKTAADGKLAVPWSAVPVDVFDRDWHAATIKTAGGDAKVDLAAARAIAAEGEWAVVQKAPALEAVRTYRTRFAGVHDAESKQQLAQLADATYGPATVAALEHGDVAGAKQAMDQWMKDAPTSAQRMHAEGEVVDLERTGTVEYLYAKYEAAIAYADGDPARLDEAEKVVTVLVEKAPADPRVTAAQALVTKKRTALAANRIKDARAHADRAKHFARHSEWDNADVEMAAATKLAAEDKTVIAAAEYVAQYKQKAGVQTTVVAKAGAADAAGTPAPDAAEKARLAAAAKAQLEAERAAQARIAAEAKQKSDADRAEQVRLAAEAKRKLDEEGARLAAESKRQADEERARKAAEAKAAADAERARIAEEKAQAAESRAKTDQEKALAREEARKATAERARVAAEEKARLAAEAKQKADEARARKVAAAAEEKAKRDEAARAEKARLAAEDKARRDALHRGTDRPAPPVRAASGAYAGLWATTIAAETVWLLDLRANGQGRTAVWMHGQIIGLHDVAWSDDGGALVVSTSPEAQVRAMTSEVGEQTMRWAGASWRRQ